MTLFEALKHRKARVLFVCLGNSCRSQMAEAFANTYGSDVLQAESAGIVPARRISTTTRQVMQESGIVIRPDTPQSLYSFDLDEFDLIVNLCDYALPKTGTRVMKIGMPDPIGNDKQFHRETRNQVERAVISLITYFRQARSEFPSRRSVTEVYGPTTLRA